MFRYIAVLLICVILPFQAWAESIIRDAEIETAIRKLAVPVFKQARLNTKDIRIIIINSPEINAFVSGGMNIFVNTGILTLSEQPDELLGVLAHETGHIAGGHLARQGEEIQQARKQLALGYILGIATAVSGAGSAGQAIALGSSHITERRMLAFSRRHEEFADQFALETLDRMRYSPKGLIDLLEDLSANETLQLGKANPYTLTHPLSRERITHIRTHIDHAKVQYVPIPASIATPYHRAIVKLKAFLEPPQKTLSAYPESDMSPLALMARAVAYSRIPDYPKSLANVDRLLATNPSDPYYQELKGQILYESGHVAEAVLYYQKALNLLPKSHLMQVQLAITQISTQDNRLLPQAVDLLNQVVRAEPENAMAWRQLAIAYGRQRQMGMSYLALAEEAAILNKKSEVSKFSRMAIKELPKGSPAALRAKDISVISGKKDD